MQTSGTPHASAGLREHPTLLRLLNLAPGPRAGGDLDLPAGDRELPGWPTRSRNVTAYGAMPLLIADMYGPGSRGVPYSGSAEQGNRRMVGGPARPTVNDCQPLTLSVRVIHWVATSLADPGLAADRNQERSSEVSCDRMGSVMRAGSAVNIRWGPAGVAKNYSHSEPPAPRVAAADVLC